MLHAQSQNDPKSKGQRPGKAVISTKWFFFEQVTFTINGVFSSAIRLTIGSESVFVLWWCVPRCSFWWGSFCIETHAPCDLLFHCPSLTSDFSWWFTLWRLLAYSLPLQQSSWPARADRLESSFPPPASALTSNYIFIKHKWLPLGWPFLLLLFVLCFTFTFPFSNSILSFSLSTFFLILLIDSLSFIFPFLLSTFLTVLFTLWSISAARLKGIERCTWNVARQCKGKLG